MRLDRDSSQERAARRLAIAVRVRELADRRAAPRAPRATIRESRTVRPAAWPDDGAMARRLAELRGWSWELMEAARVRREELEDPRP